MANTKENRGNHLADTTAKLVALKQSQPLMEALTLLDEVIRDLKANMEAQHLAAQ